MKSSKILITSAILLLTLVVTVQASWTPAPANPPENNAPQPLNVTSTSQTKDGLLMLKALITPWLAAGDAIFSGKFQITENSEGKDKVLASKDEYGNAIWKTLAELCTSTGACGGDSFWKLLPNNNIGNTNSNKGVEIEGVLLAKQSVLTPSLAAGDSIFSGKFQITNGSEGAGKILSSVDQYGNAQWVATSTLGLGGDSFWGLLPSGNLGNTNNNKNVEIGGKLVTKNIEAPACIPGSGLLGGLACMFGDVVNIGNGQISGDGKASLIVDNFVIGKNIAATSWLVAGEKFQYATSTAGEGKVLISTSTDGVADWADFSTLYQNCIETGSCPGGDSNWTIKPITGQLENSNPTGRVAIKDDLNVGKDLEVTGSSTFTGVGIYGTNALELGYFSIAPTKAANAGKVKYNKNFNTGRQSLDIYGGGTTIGDRLVNIYDNLNVSGTTTANTFCTTDGACINSLVLNKNNLFHSADVNKNWKIDSSEIGNVQSLYNAGSYHCDANTDSGYAPGPGSHACNHHSADPNGDWVINLNEFTRVSQLYNIASGYDVCLFSEDGFKPNGAGYPCDANMYSANGSLPDGTSFGETLYWDTNNWKTSKNLVNDESRFSVAVNNIIMPGQAMFTYNYDTTGQVGTIRASATGLDITGVDQGAFNRVNINDVLTVVNKIFTPNLEISGGLTLKNNGAGAGKVLTSDVAGNATWQTPTSGLPTGKNLGETLYYTGTKWATSTVLQVTGSTLTNGSVNIVSSAPVALSVLGKTFLGNNVQISQSMGIGFGAPMDSYDTSVKLDINGPIRIRGGNPGLNKVLVSDSNGVGSWVATSTILGPTDSNDVNWVKTGNNISNTNSANVGVGTNDPASLLTVFKNSSGGRGGEISIVNGAGAAVGNEAALNFGTNSSTYNGNAGDVQLLAKSTNTNGATDLIFSSWDGAAFGERMRLSAGGLVGIGTNAPTARLDVAGRIHSTGVISSDNGLSTNGTTTSTDLNVSDYAFINKLSAPSGTINTLRSVVATVDRLVVTPPSTLPQPQAGYVLTAQGTNGIAEWRPPVAGGTTLPDGTTGQTLSWNGSWSPNSVILNNGSTVTISKPTIHTDNLQVNATGAFLALGNAAVMGNLGIGVTAQSKLDVNGQITIRGGNPGLNKVLVSDSNGLATWQSASSVFSTTNYIAGTGISVSNGVITNTAPNINQTLSLNGNTISLSNGGGSVTLNIPSVPTYDFNSAIFSKAGSVINGVASFTIDIKDRAVTSTKIALNSITGGTTGNIAQKTITNANLADGTITETQLATDSVVRSKIKSQAIILNDLAYTTCRWLNADNNGNYSTKVCDRVIDGVTLAVNNPSNSTNDFIFTCPAGFTAVSGGGWCDSDSPATADYYLRESRFYYEGAGTGGGWKMSCQKTGTSVSSGRRRPGGAVVSCMKTQ